MISAETEHRLECRPAFPRGYRPGVGLVGCGDIAKSWHLPAYAKYGVRVVGVYDTAPRATEDVLERFPFVRRVFPSLDDLLADDEVEIVDVATRPDVRPELIRRAIEAGKHVQSSRRRIRPTPGLVRAERVSLVKHLHTRAIVVDACRGLVS